MYIAVTTEGNKLTDKISQNFDSCKYLMIVNMSDGSTNSIKNEKEFSEEYLAQKVIDFDCEGIITGKLNLAAFDILANACVTRYYGYGNSVEEALTLMEKNELKIIRNIDLTDECSGKHH